MLLDGGTLSAARAILSPLTVAQDDDAVDAAGRCATSAASAGTSTRRYSSNRGELLPIGSFGHTGFTGTSLWIDPATRSYVVFLSNRVHPDGKGDVTPLRAQRRDGRGGGAHRRARDAPRDARR